MHLDTTIKQQTEKIDSLLAKADKIRQGWRGSAMLGDRIDYIFTGEVTFLQSVNTSQDITFQIPENTDFYGTRLVLAPFARFTTIDQPNQGPTEIPFRPCVFSSTEGVYNQGDVLPDNVPSGIQADIASLDCMVSITENMKTEDGQITRNYQNIPTPVQMLYCSGVNYGSSYSYWANTNLTYFPDFQIPIGSIFPIDYYLPKGSSVTLKIAPIFAQNRVQDGVLALNGGGAPVLFNRQTEYQIRAFLQGYKMAGDNSW